MLQKLKCFNKFTLKVDQHLVLNKPNYDVSAVK